MRKQAFFALAVMAVGCSSGAGVDSEAPPVQDDGASPSQVQAFVSLNKETARTWTWLQHDKFKTPAHISAERKGAPVLTKDTTVEKATLAFLGRYKDLFKMRDPAAELRVAKTEVDELGMTHARFTQVTHGVEVVGAELAAHYDREGRVTSIDANFVPDLEGLDLEPAFPASALTKTIRADVLARSKNLDESDLTVSEGKLVVFALGDGPARLAYEFTARAVMADEPAIWVTTIDAKTGAVLDQYNNIQTVEATGTGVLGDTKKFEVTQSNGGFTMTDTSKGVTIRTHTARNQQITAVEGAAVVSSTQLNTWDQGVPGAGAAVDAHFNATAVFDYYKAKHGRNAINGAGGPMVSTAHFGNAFDNAFWDPQNMQMAYGDGGQLFRPLSAGLDVVAHEFTHGVTSTTSNLRYQGQSGALNESVSDIFGVFVEHALKPDDTKNWQMGEAIARQSGLLRDFKNPAAGNQPAHMSRFVNTQQDNGGVHINSGIPNNAAWLMTVGGKNPVSNVEVKFGIGWEKSEKLWFRANTRYFLQTTNFAQGAQAVMQAAKDIQLTENEQNIVDCAWKATGVVQGDCATLTDPTATTPTPSSPGDPTDETTGSAPTDENGDPLTGDEGDEESSGTSTARRRRPSLGPQSSGCAVGPHGAPDLGPLAGLAVAMLGLALGRRRRR